MPVSNATPLIYLARIQKIHLLKTLFNHVQIPPEVAEEAVNQGKTKGNPDAYAIEQAINNKWITTHTISEQNLKKSKTLAEMTGIDIGEAQAIILAKQKNEKQILIDETNARQIAKHLGLHPKGTIFIILNATKKKHITKDTAKDMLNKLIEANFYLNTKIYRDTLKAIEEL